METTKTPPWKSDSGPVSCTRRMRLPDEKTRPSPRPRVVDLDGRTAFCCEGRAPPDSLSRRVGISGACCTTAGSKNDILSPPDVPRHYIPTTACPDPASEPPFRCGGGKNDRGALCHHNVLRSGILQTSEQHEISKSENTVQYGRYMRLRVCANKSLSYEPLYSQSLRWWRNVCAMCSCTCPCALRGRTSPSRT